MQIVERIAELELTHANVAPTAVKEQVAETKQAFHSAAMDQCVGKRITEDALRCVREAKSAKEIVDDCFN